MNGKEWRPEHTELLKRYEGVFTDWQFAEATGHTRETITRRRTALGLSPARRPDLTRRGLLMADAAGLVED